MLHQMIIQSAAILVILFSMNTSAIRSNKQLLFTHLGTRSHASLGANSNHFIKPSNKLCFCQTMNNKCLSTTNWMCPSGRQNGRMEPGEQAKRKMTSHDNTQFDNDLEQSQEGVGVGKYDGARTRFGRRERRTDDRLTKNARVRNSYLKVIMEDAVFDELHDLICEVRRQWEEEDKARSDDQQTATSKKQSKRRLAIKPRSRNSLHMTYFFAGKVLEEMTSEELQRWERLVRKCVTEHNNNGVSAGDYSLRFKRLATFPPGRQNLVVALFEPSASLDDLYERLCDVATMEKEHDAAENASGDGKDYEFPLLRVLTQKQQNQRKQHASRGWIAHVTVGNLAGGSKEDVCRLSEWLGDRNHSDDVCAIDGSEQFLQPAPEATSNAPLKLNDVLITKTENTCLLGNNIDALGLALGGPVPEHVDIDWNFPFNSIR